jgi:hypothetical protein
VIPCPQGVESEGLRALGVKADLVDIRRLGVRREILQGEPETGTSWRVLSWLQLVPPFQESL